MPRIARKYSQSNFNHVIVQGIKKEYIFSEEKYIEKYKEFIIKKLEDTDIKMLAYCIMSNHAHFLIYSEKIENLSKFMQKLNTSYSNFYNKEKNRVGYVFRDRYYSKEIMNEKQLYNCLKYIHNNPVKANIVREMNEYKYSSYNEFVGEKEVITEESIKILFGSAENYMEQFKWIHKNYSDEDFFDVEDKEDILEFINKVEEKYGKKFEEIKKEKDLIKRLIRESREKTDVTISRLAEILNLPRSTIGRYSKK